MYTSILTKKQEKTYGPKIYTKDGETFKLTAKVRYDDQCNNGHNSFAITGEQYRKNNHGKWEEDSFGRMHETIAQHFPELAPYIKWHSTSSEGPMHYIANTVYHVQEHGPQYAWVYYTGLQDPLKIQDIKEQLLDYVKAWKAKEAEGKPGYRVKWDENTIKVRNLNAARSCAVWPDATDEELTAPGLEMRLQSRHHVLMEEFKMAIESLGFVY